MNLDSLTFPIVQISLDVTSIDECLETAAVAVDAGVDFIVHHIGYDERRMVQGLSPMDELDAVVRAVSVPVQAVGGLSIRQAIECPSRGAPLVVLGAPLVIAPDDFKAAEGASLRDILAEICGEIRSAQGLGRTRP